MIAASAPAPRQDARLVVIGASGAPRFTLRRELAGFLGRGDVLVVNDAATVPASLRGTHLESGRDVELRLAARRALDARDVCAWRALLFGAGDHRTPTEHRPPAPRVSVGDRLALGPLVARVTRVEHARLCDVVFEGTFGSIWEGIARHGRPVQYAHVPLPLETWDVWTPIAGPPVAVEPPSAGFALDWALLSSLADRGVEVVSLTHAAGLSSTGDSVLDALLPLDEPYDVPARTALAVDRARAEGRRVVAVGTTVVRALESAASEGGRLRAGRGLARLRLSAEQGPRVVTAILSGTHEPGTSHYRLLEGFAPAAALRRATEQMSALGYRTHEFGDSMLVERRSAVTGFRTAA